MPRAHSHDPRTGRRIKQALAEVLMNEDANYSAAMDKFREWMSDAERLELQEPSAMTLATADAAGHVTARVVLLRGLDERGFVFYTNSESLKGQQLASNPWAALCFYWDLLGRQVRVEGAAARVNDEESDAYWRRRPRESQIGAWASLQSQLLINRELLERRFAEIEHRFAGHDIPRPEHWYGFCVAPERIEFWVNRPSRLHEREVFELRDNGWITYLLYP